MLSIIFSKHCFSAEILIEDAKECRIYLVSTGKPLQISNPGTKKIRSFETRTLAISRGLEYSVRHSQRVAMLDYGSNTRVQLQEKIKFLWPGCSHDPKLLDDVIGLLSRLMLTQLLAMSHYCLCYYIMSSAQCSVQRQRQRQIANASKADMIPPLYRPP